MGARAIRESFKKKVLKFNPYHDEKGRFTDAEGIGSHGFIDHPESRRAAAAIFSQSSRVEPEVSQLMQTMERDGAKLQYPDKSLKGLGSLQRKILSESKRLGTPISEVPIADSLRYTLEVPTDRYAQRVTDSLQEMESKGYKVTDFRNTWAPGAVYQGVNVNLKTPHGVTMELQFHTPESFHTKSKLNGKLYKRWRLDGVSKDEQDLLWARMVHNQQQVPIPEGVQGLRWTVKKSYAQILKFNPHHDALGRFADADAAIAALAPNPRPMAFKRGDGYTAFVHLNTRVGEGKWRVTYLTPKMNPTFHHAADDFEGALRIADMAGFDVQHEVALKHNPYHDELGRFTFADGAVSESIGPKFAAHVKRMREEYAKTLAGQYTDDSKDALGEVGAAALKVPKGYANYTYKEMELGKPETGYLEDPLTKDTISVADAQKLYSAPAAQLEIMYPEPKYIEMTIPPKNIPGGWLPNHVHDKLPMGFKDFTQWGPAGGEAHGGWIKNPSTGEAVLLSDALSTKDTGKLNEMYQVTEKAKGKVEYADPTSGLAKGTGSDSALNQTMTDASAANWASLTPKQKQALSEYSSDSTRLNAYVTGTYERENDRRPDWAMSERVTDEQQDIYWIKRETQLDDALRYTVIPTNVYSYRSVSERAITNLFGPGNEYRSGYDQAVMQGGPEGALKSLIGKEFKDPAYGSSSIDYNRAYSFHRSSRVMLRIRNKKGEAGMYFGNDRDRTAFPSEHELLLPRGTRYKIKGVKLLGSTYVLDVWKVGAKKAKV
jgi:hypothetical protein